MEVSYAASTAGQAHSGLTSPSETAAAAEDPSDLVGSAQVGDAATEAQQLDSVVAEPRAGDAQLESAEDTQTSNVQETALQAESASDTERAAGDSHQWQLSLISAAQQHETEAHAEERTVRLLSGVDYYGEQETDDEDELQHTAPASASSSQQQLLDLQQQQQEEEQDLLTCFGLELGSLPSEAAIAALELLAAEDDAASAPPPSALRPSAVVQSLSLAQLDELLDFRSSLGAAKRSQAAAAGGRPSESRSSSRPSLAASLRSLEHVLAHPLPCPSLPSQRKGYQSATLSASQRSAAVSSLSPSSRLPAYEQMALRSSSTSRLYSQLHAELADIQQAAAALASAYPLDAVNAGLLTADTAARHPAGEAADGSMAAVSSSRLRTVRKERCDYISAAHSRSINRQTRRRQAHREETEVQHLLQAVSHTTQT